MSNIAQVFVVDDDESVRIALHEYISEEGYEVMTAATIDEANGKIRIKEIDYAIVDLTFTGDDFGGVRIIENINKLKPSTKIIVLTGYNDPDEVRDKLKNVKYDIYLSKGDPDNYISNVIEALEKLKKQQTPKNCFVIMPFSKTELCTEKDWDDVFYLLRKPAVEKAGYNYVCKRNDQHVGSIIKSIMKNLNSADLVIADLTNQNANVFYELGVRHTLNTPTILITQNSEHVPFDLQDYKFIEYNRLTGGVKKLKKDIKNAIKEIEKNEKASRKINYSPVGDYLQLNI